MKFTLAALAAITLSQAHAYEPACPPAQTVTVTHTVKPGPSYIPQDNGNYGPGQHYPGGPHQGKPWGSQKPHRPYKPRPDYPSTSVVTQTSYVGPSVPPVTQTSTITFSSTVSASQTLYYPPAAATHTVIVGGKDAAGAPILKFDPEVVFAAIGDSVVYDFRANNHSLTESTFEIPCEAKQAGGFKSGFLDNEADVAGEQLFTVYVEDELPHWAYCGQKQPVNHCQKGMVHAINPPLTGDRTFEAFKDIATGPGYSSPPIIPSYSPLPPYLPPNATYPPAGYPGPTDYPTAAYPTAPYPTAVYPSSSVTPPREIGGASSANGSPTVITDPLLPSQTAGDAYPSSSDASSSASAGYPASSSTSEDKYSILPVETVVPVQY